MTEEIDLLQQILAELQRLNRPTEVVGFAELPTTKRIHCNRQYGSSMYFWRGEVERELIINQDAIVCRVTGITVEAGEFKGNPNHKLLVAVSADQSYVLTIGLESFTAKSMLLGLRQVDLTQTLTLGFRAGKDAKVLFCDVWQFQVRLKHDQDLKAMTESEVLQLVEEINQSLQDSNLSVEIPQIEESELAPLESVTEASDRATVMAGIDDALEQINWGRQRGSDYLKKTYKKATRAELSDLELGKFYRYLKGLEVEQRVTV